VRQDGERSPFARPWFVASAGLLVVLAVLVVVLTVTRTGGAHHAQATAAAHTPVTHRSSTSTAATSSADASGGGGGPDHCGLLAGSQAVPTAPPPASWTLEGSMAIPASPTAGPERHVDGFPVCYAHNPRGALFAAVAFWAAATAAPPATVYARLAADTPTRAQAIASARGDNSRLSDSGQVSLAGFTFASYSPQSASVAVVLQTTQDSMVAVTCTMVWQQGDWRYEIPPGGTPPASQITGLDGYVPWGAAS
jgi:hypothetical protein